MYRTERIRTRSLVLTTLIAFRGSQTLTGYGPCSSPALSYVAIVTVFQCPRRLPCRFELNSHPTLSRVQLDTLPQVFVDLAIIYFTSPTQILSFYHFPIVWLAKRIDLHPHRSSHPSQQLAKRTGV
jgi:hypothetical protein